MELIGSQAFWGSKNSTTVNIGSGVKHIGRFAFAYCNSLEEIKVMGCYAFSDCGELASIAFASAEDNITKGRYWSRNTAVAASFKGLKGNEYRRR